MQARLTDIYHCDATEWEGGKLIGMQANAPHIMAIRRMEQGELSKLGTADYKQAMAILTLAHYGDQAKVDADLAKWLEVKVKEECEQSFHRTRKR